MSCTDVQVKAWDRLFIVELRTKDINQLGVEPAAGTLSCCRGSGVCALVPWALEWGSLCLLRLLLTLHEFSISSGLIFLTPGHHGPLTSPSARVQVSDRHAWIWFIIGWMILSHTLRNYASSYVRNTPVCVTLSCSTEELPLHKA